MYITCASSRYNWLLLPFLVIVSVSLSAQNPQTYIQQSGMPIFTTTQAVELGFINLSNGNLHIEIPLGAFPQRGTMPTFAAKLIYDSRIWGFSDLSGGWKPYNPGSSDGISTVSTNSYCCGGWRFVTSADPGMVNNQSHYEDCNDSQEQINDGFLWTAADGTSHYFPIQTSFHNCPSDPPPDASGGADDGSGYFMKVTNAFTPVVLGPDGTQVYPQIEDTNGNYFSYDANTNVAIDTLGRVPVVVTPNCNGNSSLICYDVLNSAGGRSRYTATFMQIDVCTNFGVSGPDYCPGNPNYPYVPVTVIQSIALPNNTSYTFDYDAGTTPGKFGLLKTVTLPTGGQVGYTHAIFVESSGLRNLWVNSYSSNGNGWTLTPQVTVSCSGLQPCEQQITVTKPTGDKSVYTFGIWTSNGPWNTRIQYQKSDSTLLMDVQNDVPFDKCADQAATYTSTVTVPSQSGPSAVKKTSYAYPMTYSGSDNCWISAKTNPIRKDEYAFGQGVSGPLIRSTAYSYLSDSAYVARNITDRPLSEVVSDGVGNIAAQTQYEYDNYTEGIATTGAPQHDLNYGSGFLIRGNVTATSRWRNTDGAWLTTRNQFDDAGNVRKTTDPGQHVTTLDFTDDWAGSGCVSSNTQAYATMITNALSQQTKKKYYPCTGLTQSMRDQNDINAGRSGTTYTYDVIGRPLVTSLPDGGQTTVTYNGDPIPAHVTKTVLASPSPSIITDVFYDGLGRVTQSRLTSDPQGTDYTDTTYDSLGRTASISNPYRSTTESTYGITQYQYDGLDRVTDIIRPDGGTVHSDYSGNQTTVKDEAGNKRVSVADGIGRLIQVVEPNPSSGSLTSGTYPTYYTYDALDNLISVNQVGDGSAPRIRSFTYDSLSRLLESTNPETGRICFGTLNGSTCNRDGYDADGNLLYKTDARGILINYSPAQAPIDALHRIKMKTYSTSDPSVSYFYDQTSYNGLTIVNGVGRRTGMSDASGLTAWSYDAMGRELSQRRTIRGITKNIARQYDLNGMLSSLTYPSGDAITYSNSGAGRPTSVANQFTNVRYITNAAYAPHGSITSYTNSSSSISVTNTYNKRLQPNQLSAQNSSNVSVLKLTYDFHLGAGDNGNVYQINNVLDGSRTQSFIYDSLNRLVMAQTPFSSLWGDLYSYDPWGNLLQKTPIKGTSETLSVTVNGNNRLTGYAYDLAGNLINDQLGHTMTYDAEGRISTAAGTTNTYDGDGNRTIYSDAGLFWGGNQTVLADTNVSGLTQHEYIFFAGKRVAFLDSGSNLFYYFPDHLNSVRVITKGQGGIFGSSDYYPWGGERVILPYSNQNFKFTGQKRDVATGFDYFGARYYLSNLGRWLSPDSITLTDQRILNPANTLNKYVYAGNDPMKYVDADGRDIILFYDHNLPAGHLMLAAFNEETGDFAIKSFGPRDHDSATMTKEAVGISVPGQEMYALDQIKSVDDLRNNYSSLTIQTSPEIAQQAIQLIRSQRDGKYNTYTNNCTTTCAKILKELKLNVPGPSWGMRPVNIWYYAYGHYGNHGPQWDPWTSLPSQNGKDYGRPRADFKSFDWLYLRLQCHSWVTVDKNGGGGRETFCAD